MKKNTGPINRNWKGGRPIHAPDVRPRCFSRAEADPALRLREGRLDRRRESVVIENARDIDQAASTMGDLQCGVDFESIVPVVENRSPDDLAAESVSGGGDIPVPAEERGAASRIRQRFVLDGDPEESDRGITSDRSFECPGKDGGAADRLNADFNSGDLSLDGWRRCRCERDQGEKNDSH